MQLPALPILILALGIEAAQAQVRVVDGDTFDLNGVRIRINGIDAPEYGQTCGHWDCGAAALEELQRLLASGLVTCSPLGDDGYGRVIASCRVGDTDLGAAMVSEGLAMAFVKYSDAYVLEEKEARERAAGIWSGPFQPPWEYRAEKWSAAEDDAPAGCPIKGNISENGKIYHPPWSPWYTKTRIDETKGERWFCNEAEAVEAGWRAPIWR